MSDWPARYDTLFFRLADVKRAGAWWNARCPAHEDNKQSLRLGVGERGIVFKCFAGCEKEAILKALGLKWKDVMEASTMQRQIAATYDYCDEAGKMLFQCVRYDPKDFRQRRPDGRGGWVWNLSGVRMVLYRLPELLEALDKVPNRRVLLVEGEKDVETLRGLGFTATTNPMGAGKWRPEYSKTLAGRNVCVIPDKDKPATRRPGDEHAATVCASLLSAGARVNVVDLPQEGEAKVDISSYLAKCSTDKVAEIKRLAEGATPAEQWLAKRSGHPDKLDGVIAKAVYSLLKLDTASPEAADAVAHVANELAEASGIKARRDTG